MNGVGVAAGVTGITASVVAVGAMGLGVSVWNGVSNPVGLDVGVASGVGLLHAVSTKLPRMIIRQVIFQLSLLFIHIDYTQRPPRVGKLTSYITRGSFSKLFYPFLRASDRPSLVRSLSAHLGGLFSWQAWRSEQPWQAWRSERPL